MIRRGSGAFTLIEVMVSTALAMALAALSIGAFLQIRKAVDRAEARIALHASAQSLYTTMRSAFAAAQQSCAVVLYSDPDAVQLTYMRARESAEDYAAWSKPDGNTPPRHLGSHLAWERWTWRRSDRTLRLATSRRVARGPFEPNVRQWSMPSFTPDASSGVNLTGKTFRGLPQPRRYLTPSDPTGPLDTAQPARRTLDDNIYFPTAADPRLSLVDVEDMGDWTDLDRAETPVLAQVRDLCFQFVHHDEAYVSPHRPFAVPATPAGTTWLAPGTATTTVLQGVWLDGRLGSSLAPPQVFTGSDASKRPRLLRVCFTLRDDLRDLEQTFSFSFAWPGMSPPP